MSRLDPPHDRNVSFLFTRCQARLDGDDLLVTVPSPRVSCRGGVSTADAQGLRWEPPLEAPGAVVLEAPAEVVIDCEPGPRQRSDRSEYPLTQAYPRSALFRFRGGVLYGRLAQKDGWVLSVQAVVRAVSGLPEAFAGYEAVLVETTFQNRERKPQTGAPQAGAPQAGALLLGAQPLFGAQPLAARSSQAAENGPAEASINGPHLPFP